MVGAAGPSAPGSPGRTPSGPEHAVPMRSSHPLKRTFTRFLAAVFAAAAIVCATVAPTGAAAGRPGPSAPVSGDYRVDWVIDGDTVVIRGGAKVRYIGLDTPERGEPFYGAARRRNISLVGGRTVRLEFCGPEPTDRYGRLLAWVYADGELVNLILLREGLARVLIIPPCGTDTGRAGELRAAERAAREDGIGIWARP